MKSLKKKFTKTDENSNKFIRCDEWRANTHRVCFCRTKPL